MRPAAGPEQFLFLTPVWGAKYVERYLSASLPSQLADGNLGAVPPGRGKYLIFTRREHVGTIRQSPAFRQLQSMMPVALRSLDDLPSPSSFEHPHVLQTAAYTRGIRAGAKKDTAYAFLTPDGIYADGAFRSMVRFAESGRRVILLATIRMTAAGALACVERHRTPGAAHAAVPPRRLVRAMLDNLHPISESHIVNGGAVGAAQHLYWKVGDNGLVAHGFHLHPFLVWPRNRDARIRNTLDDEYIANACPDQSDWFVVPDSEELCVCEFSEPGHKSGFVTTLPLIEEEIVQFILYQTCAAHRTQVRQQIRFQSADVPEDLWSATGAIAEEFVCRHLDGFERAASFHTAPRPGILKRLLNGKMLAYAGRLEGELHGLRTELRETRIHLARLVRKLGEREACEHAGA